MATHFLSIKVSDKTYHLSHSGETVYYSSSSKTGGTALKRAKFVSSRNEFLLFDGRNYALPKSHYEIAEAIRNN